MHCINKFTDYSDEEIGTFLHRVNDFKEIFENANNILRIKKDIIEGKTKKPEIKVVKGEVTENCIWIDPSIEVKFRALTDAKLPLHSCLDIYDEWFDQLFKLTIVNEHVLTKKSVFAHIVGILVICSTFHGIIEAAIKSIEDSPEPPPVPPKISA